jgi:hypothetical protein
MGTEEGEEVKPPKGIENIFNFQNLERYLSKYRKLLGYPTDKTRKEPL